MKKRVFISTICMLLLTGCTCEYNLTIDKNTYKEEIVIIGETSEEILQLNNQWKISVDKDEYALAGDPDTPVNPQEDTYKYTLSGNKLTFNYDFTTSGMINSSAVSNCYNKLNITSYNNTTIISTGQNALCYEKNPPLTSLRVNIKVDRKVIKHNADNVNGNTYTWIITKDNANNKPIDLILDDSEEEEIITPTKKDPKKTKHNSYGLYIFSGILLILIFIGYKIFNKIKNRDELND